MNRSKLLLYTIIINLSLLTSCSSHTKIDQLSSDFQTLNFKIDQINNDISAIQSDLQVAKEDAARSNQRLDNHLSSYRKAKAKTKFNNDKKWRVFAPFFINQHTIYHNQC